MPLTRSLLIVALLLVLPGLVVAAAGPAEKAEKIKVLIIDGQNFHDWKATTPVIKEAFEKSGRFEVDVLTSSAKGAKKEDWAKFTPDFSKYGAVLLNYQGDKWPEEVATNFEKYMAGGGGLVVYHFASAAFPEWDAYNKMIGMGWSRDPKTSEGLYLDAAGKEVRRAKGEGKGGFHGPAHVYACTVIDKDAPLTAGLPAKWSHIKDELYGSLRGPAKDMHILVTAFSSKEGGGTGENEPVVWTLSYEKGRVFVNVLGHAVPETAAPDTMILLERGTEWAATGKVTLPVPADFPKEAAAAPAATPTATK
jgi:type 1 glutamine amidotransferase